MFLFGRKKEEPVNHWEMEVGGVSFIDSPKLGDIENQLTVLQRGNSEFFILKPDKPVKKCNFMQVTNDKDPQLFHVEFSILKDDKGYVLYGKDALSFEKAFDLFIEYMVHGQIPDTKDWYIVMES